MLAGAAAADILVPAGRLGKWAPAFAMLTAAAPDADTLPAFLAAFPANPFGGALFDPGLMHAFHRGYTHALPVMAAAGIVFGLAGRRWLGGRSGGGALHWIGLAWAAFLTHVLLDMANGAVRLWEPFSSRWIGWGQFPEADPFLCGVLVLCFLASHPYQGPNRRNLGTLRLYGQASGWLHRTAAQPLGPRTLAALCLGAAAVRIAAGVWPK